MFCTLLNNRLVKHLDIGKVLHEGQAGSWVKRSCVDSFNELVWGRLREENKIYTFFWRHKNPMILYGVMVCG